MDEQKEAEILSDSRWKIVVEASGGRSHVKHEQSALNGMSCPRVKSIYGDDGEYQLDIKQSTSSAPLNVVNGRDGWWFVVRSKSSRKKCNEENPFHFVDLNGREDEVLGIPGQGSLTLSLTFDGKPVVSLGPHQYKKTPLGNGIKGHKRNIRLEKNKDENSSSTTVGDKRKRSNSSTPLDHASGLVRLLPQEEEHGKWLPVVAVRMFVPWELLPSEFTSEERTQRLHNEFINRTVPRHICFNRNDEAIDNIHVDHPHAQHQGKRRKKIIEPLPVEQIFEFDKRKPAAFRLSLMRIGDERVSMDCSGYTIKELKDQLSELNLPITGSKNQLLERFKNAHGKRLAEEADSTGSNQASPAEISNKDGVTATSLRQMLKELGIPTSGKKEDLIKRLEEHKNNTPQQSNNTISHLPNPITA